MSTGLTFGTDQVLLYNVEPWNTLGFGVPNFGNNLKTQNLVWFRLADEIGKAQLSIMAHIDARRAQYPSINTIIRMARMLNRIKAVILNRQKQANEIRLEPLHVTPASFDWNIHPVPWAQGLVANPWLFEYNHLCMYALSNIYQHSDNNLALEMTAEGGRDIWGYFRRMTELVAGELLSMDRKVYTEEAFMFVDADVQKAYNPASLPREEALITPVGTDTGWTEDDLGPLRQGYPANQILPLLARWSVTKFDGNPPIPQGTRIQEGPLPGTITGAALAPIV
jgi:hypothetical protein